MKLQTMVCAAPTDHAVELEKHSMLPRGSALLTSSGKLEESSLITIAHAATVINRVRIILSKNRQRKKRCIS